MDAAKGKMKELGTSESQNNAAKIRNSYKYIDPLKMPSKSDRTELDKFTTRQIVDTKDGALPPNFAEEGTSQLTYRNGRVYFGEGAESCLKNGMSTSEFLTNVIKNKK